MSAQIWKQRGGGKASHEGGVDLIIVGYFLSSPTSGYQLIYKPMGILSKHRSGNKGEAVRLHMKGELI